MLLAETKKVAHAKIQVSEKGPISERWGRLASPRLNFLKRSNLRWTGVMKKKESGQRSKTQGDTQRL